MISQTTRPIAVLRTGLVTSVGLSAPAACAAIRAGVANPIETRFRNSLGEWIVGHAVPLVHPWRGHVRHVKMLATTVEECLDGVPLATWAEIPLLLCVAEQGRPGRLEELDHHLLPALQQELGTPFAPVSAVLPHGRVSVALALMQARRLLLEGHAQQVLIAAVDSLLMWPTLSAYERDDRVLTSRNSNGFMPGEAAGALLVGLPKGGSELRCVGIGLGTEPAHIGSGEPLRGDGLTLAVKSALAEAGCEMHDLDYRITDLSGEQYYFKEASLALNRILRKRKEDLELWHPAECTGEAGAAAGVICLAVAHMADAKRYAPGRSALLHFAGDNGARAAIVADGN